MIARFYAWVASLFEQPCPHDFTTARFRIEEALDGFYKVFYEECNTCGEELE